jgi:hypothetical protein
MNIPKVLFRLPEDPTKLKTFLIYDELEEVKKMNTTDFLLYFFRNMLIYESNLIFDHNFQLDYNFDYVDISLKDFREFFPRLKISEIKNCEKVDKETLCFRFDVEKLKSLNKKCVIEATGDNTAKSRQYIIISFDIILSAFRELSPKCKDFLLYIFSLYHYKPEPVIQHNLTNMLKACNITLHEGKQKALDRVNKYLYFLWTIGIVENTSKFKKEGLLLTHKLNFKLKRIDKYYKNGCPLESVDISDDFEDFVEY